MSGSDIWVGVDVGGTFTDAVLTDGAKFWTAKFPTSANVTDGILGACGLAAERSGTTLRELLPRVKRFGLGTTAVTNAIASRRGARVGLLTTRGFEETLSFTRGRMVSTDQRLHHGAQLVAAEDIIGIHERVDRNGAVLQPLDPDEVIAAAGQLVAAGVEAIAISFLWSPVNPDHELRAANAIAREWPQLWVTGGAELLPVLREYERTTLAVLNAYVSTAFLGVEALADRLAVDGMVAPLLLVHSGGGTISVAEARTRPVWLAESGPAAGVSAAATLAVRSGVQKCITCDMGGTSFDVSHVEDGAPSRVSRGDLMDIWTALPRIDVESIGAGGGSIAWIDARGMLCVGPQSAGSSPGPVCYGRGGVQPTVTDALVVLRYIDPDNFLGGDMALDRDAALDACAELGARLGLDAEAAAWGIREIALAEMTRAVRTRLAMQGLDPREHPLVSYGGCASLFTADIAKALSAPRVIVPDVASVLSAQGAATAQVRRERVRTVMRRMPVDPATIETIAGELARQVDADLAADGVAAGDRELVVEADLRFFRQLWDLTIPLPPGLLDEGALDLVLAAFREEYVRRYGAGSTMAGTPVELVALRAVGTGPPVLGDASLPRLDIGAEVDELGAGRTRAVRFGSDETAYVEVGVFDDLELAPGRVVQGPAVIDRSDTTIWVPAGVRASRDGNDSIVLEVS